MEGVGRGRGGVVGAGRPTGRPIARRPLPPPPSPAHTFRGERRLGGDKLREGGRRRGKDRRLARWSLPERISYFQLPDRPFLQPLPILASLLLFLPSSFSPGVSLSVSHSFSPPFSLFSSLYLCFLFSSHPPPSNPLVTVLPPPLLSHSFSLVPQTVTLRLLVGDRALPLSRAPLRFSYDVLERGERWREVGKEGGREGGRKRVWIEFPHKGGFHKGRPA